MTAATTSRHGLAALLAGLAVVATACGDSAKDTDRDAPAANAAKTTPKTAAATGIDLAALLMRAGEEPGFRPGAQPGARPASVQTFTGVDAFARSLGLPADEVRRLRGEGFLAFTVGPIRGPRNAAGLTNAAVYETAAGAKRSMTHDMRPDVIRAGGPLKGLRFFSVAGVPGARGWSASEPPVANVSWVQGRCYMTLGNQGADGAEKRLSAGARAIHERTRARCG